MVHTLLRIMAYLPLGLLHALGAAAGWAVYLLSPRYRARLQQNLRVSGVCRSDAMYRQTLRQSVAAAGKSVLELIPVWYRPHRQVLALLKDCDGCGHIDAAIERGKGIIFLTPHLGCFEITSLYYSACHPITILYRPPKLKWLQALIDSGRRRGQATLAPTDLGGVKALLKALKRGEAIGILPDQVPGQGEGVWAPFFGRPAYTMSLVARLHKSSDAAILLAFGERLSFGRGYRLWIRPFQGDLSGDAKSAAAELNREIENVVRRCPAQYLWSYNRYKTPRGATREA
ncbi:MAG: lysophospholipid acyltransferase family protein [Sulfuricellaceae bacterium]|nr:lysophospholipid acyltransferase family protein [Sulfuricellaceae bacterium]